MAPGTFSTVKVDARKAYRKVAKAKLAASRIGRDTVKSLAETGKQYARSIAPHYNGRLAQHIVKRTKGTPKDVKAQVLAMNPTRGGNGRLLPGGAYPNFNLVRWMHETGGVFKSPNPFQSGRGRHIKSGDPRFMYTTRNYLNKIKKGVAKGKHKKINLR